MFLRKKNTKGADGYSLAEVIVSLTIFVIFTIILTNVFILFLKEHRKSLLQRELVDQGRTLIEHMKYDLSNADIVTESTGSTDACYTGGKNPSVQPIVYSQDAKSNVLFLNKSGDCSAYSFDETNERLRKVYYEWTGSPGALSSTGQTDLTSSNVNVTRAIFTIYEDQFVDQQPMVNVFFELEAPNSGLPAMPIQFNASISK